MGSTSCEATLWNLVTWKQEARRTPGINTRGVAPDARLSAALLKLAAPSTSVRVEAVNRAQLVDFQRIRSQFRLSFMEGDRHSCITAAILDSDRQSVFTVLTIHKTTLLFIIWMIFPIPARPQFDLRVSTRAALLCTRVRPNLSFIIGYSCVSVPCCCELPSGFVIQTLLMIGVMPPLTLSFRRKSLGYLSRLLHLSLCVVIF